MKEMKEIFDEISEEIDGAEKYAKEALRLHDSEPERAMMYLEMSKQELNHLDRLHEMAKRIVRKYKEEGKTIPPGMQEIYDWQHEKMIKCVAWIRQLHQMYK